MEKPVMQHFNHEHLLERRLLPPEENCVCFGCKLEVSPGKLCYKCKNCPFYLHQVCYNNMPREVQHPRDGGDDRKHHDINLSAPLPDNLSTPSLQFSDACFSIDIERSFTGDQVMENKGVEDLLQRVDQEPEEKKVISYIFVNKGTFSDPKSANHLTDEPPSFSIYVGSSPQKGEVGTPVPAIGSPGWVQLGQKNEPIQPKNASDAGLQHQAKDSDSGCWSSCW